MEGRKLKIIFNKRGDGTLTPKISLPMKDVKRMNAEPDDREVNYYFDEENEVMILSKKELKKIKLVIEK